MGRPKSRRAYLWRRGTSIVAQATLLCVVVGCSRSAEDPAGASTQETNKSVASPSQPRRTSSGQRKSARSSALEVYSARSGKPAPAAELDTQAAAMRTLAIVRQSAEYEPTFVVWLLDISPSAMTWGREIHAAIRQFYQEDVPRLNTPESTRLETAVWTIGESAAPQARRTIDPETVIGALRELVADPSGIENTFAGIQQAWEQYLPVRTSEKKALLFVLVSDEAGNDWQLVDQLVHAPRKYAVPFYVIGVPAPFGRTAALDESVEPEKAGSATTTSSLTNILQGPETRELERIQLKFPHDATDYELMDSGFGPFGLEWLCRSSGGQFLAVRNVASQDFGFETRRLRWPTLGLATPDQQIMRRYRPANVTAAEYQAALASNQALMALHRAAQLPPIDVLRDAQLTFLKRSEADLKNLLDKAQQAAAKVAPDVDKLYELLREGAGAAPQLASRRWQASFQLAFGRACAAKARIDGYNSMLAALKRGRNFEDPASTTWVLQAASTTDLNSSLQKLIERARSLLNDVVTNHSGTPWAEIAQFELEEPMGWQWTEQR